MMTLAMTLRFHALGFVAGLLLVAMGGYGLHEHEPIPADKGFSTPIPYDWFFLGVIIVGAVMVLRALAKGSELAR